MTEEKLKISAGTVIRLIVLTLTLVNQTLTATGRNPLPISESALYEWLTLAATAAAALWAAWKNNSLTQAALAADELMSELKSAEKEKEYE